MSFTVLFFSLFLAAQLLRVRSVDEDLEVVLLPMQWSSEDATVALRFSAFGKNVDLLLKRNEHLAARNFEVWRRDHHGPSRLDDQARHSSCHYLHENSHSSAAVSLCDAGTVQGFIFYEDDSLEITPLYGDENSSVLLGNRLKVRSSASSTLGEPHVIKRRRTCSFRMSPRHRESSSADDGGIEPEATTSNETLTIELAVFLDEAAYKLFAPYLSGDEAKLLDLLLAYVNNIQALYHHRSLGRRIDLALVRLELMQSQPPELAGLDGERSEALDAFCKYSQSLNPPGDDQPKHWDMGLYVSGLDFYALENGQRSPVTMGLAPVGGVCWDRYACVIAEFGVNNKFGRPFPSAGFTSVYIAAHEMAHNLGMHHDGAGNECPKDGFIMSASRGTRGESQWSSCSREVALTLPTSKPCLLDKPGMDYQLEPQHQLLDHRRRFGQVPGRFWTAKRQCELLLRDNEALVDSLHDCCTSLRCKSPRRSGLFLAGPALDGTVCAEGKECRAGDCLPLRGDNQWEAHNKPASETIGWSAWRESDCQSGCIRGSLGFTERRRSCLGLDSQCQGASLRVSLCKDAQVCRERKRLSASEHASLRCLEFSARGVEAIDGGAGGLQAEHEPERPWMGCALFCKHKRIASFYSPRDELLRLGLEPYFPDGTWCHRHDGRDFFCRMHHCLPEDFRFDESKSLMLLDDEPLMIMELDDQRRDADFDKDG